MWLTSQKVPNQDVIQLVTQLRHSGLAAASVNRALATIRTLYNAASAPEITKKTSIKD